MILYEWSGDDIDNKDLFIPNDNLFLIFNTDKTNNASGFILHYEIIEKGRFFLVFSILIFLIFRNFYIGYFGS